MHMLLQRVDQVNLGLHVTVGIHYSVQMWPPSRVMPHDNGKWTQNCCLILSWNPTLLELGNASSLELCFYRLYALALAPSSQARAREIVFSCFTRARRCSSWAPPAATMPDARLFTQSGSWQTSFDTICCGASLIWLCRCWYDSPISPDS
jgi:hypothetical protein